LGRRSAARNKFITTLTPAYFERGDVYSTLDKAELALADYDNAIKLNPNYWNAYLNRGYLYESLTKFDSAIADYNRVIESNSDEFRAITYLRRGSTYAQAGDKENATKDLLKAIALDSGIGNEVNTRLESVGYKPPGELPLFVFLQYSDAVDSPVVDAVASSLRKVGFNVQPKELVVRQTPGDVRFYSEYSRNVANNIGKMVAETVLEKFGVKLEMITVYLGKVYPLAPRGNIEVWIPPLRPSLAK
jgi:tetratricopeptide (TPR) repeat protein